MDLLKAYSQDPRIPCHYGRKCYQKNPNHHTKYKHPPDPKRKNQYLDNNTVKRKRLNSSDSVDKKTNGSSSNDTTETSGDSPKTEAVISNDVSDSESDETASNTKECCGKKVFSNDVSDSETDNENLNNSNDITTNDSEDVTDTPNCESSTPCNHSEGHNNESSREYIKSNFLFEMPSDFYKFYELCERLNPEDPSKALAAIDLTLVGPFDVLLGKFCGVSKNVEDYLIHWRYYYDPPNFQTVLKGDDKTGYHIGYFRDNPDDKPVFLTENYGVKDGILTPLGENIFGAVSSYIEDKKKTCDPFSKMKFVKFQNVIKEEAEKLGYDLSRKTKEMTKRNNKILSRTFNKIGLVVPYERKTQLGYRKLAMSEKDLETLLTKIDKAHPEQKSKLLAELQSEILTWTDIACDECDFGTGIELGWDILCTGVNLNNTISRLLSSNYRQLKWEAFAKIAEAHMANRRKGCDLSVL